MPEAPVQEASGEPRTQLDSRGVMGAGSTWEGDRGANPDGGGWDVGVPGPGTGKLGGGDMDEGVPMPAIGVTGGSGWKGARGGVGVGKEAVSPEERTLSGC